MPGLVVDLFAGGGGASVGIEAALGRPVDIAINHDPVAIAVHKANHPQTEHWESDIWEVKPLEATRGRPVDLLWASPDCTHFSVAKGGQPRQQNIRSLAWVVVRWAKEVTPSVIALENVSEFQGWGPLGPDRKPVKSKMGQTFKAWRRKLERLGYAVDYQVGYASDFGAPTRRRRLFLIARCDGDGITWPLPTHGKGLQPYHTAAECIDWSHSCPSIFGRDRPLVEKTLWRLAQGVKRFVLETARPFIVKVNHGIDAKTGRREYSIDQPLTTVTGTAISHALVAPTLIQTGYGERVGQGARVPGLDKPLGTIVAGGQKHALVAAFIAKGFGGQPGRWEGGGSQPVDRPAPTVTSRDHTNLAAATLIKFRGRNHGAQVELPLPTVTGGGTHLGEVRAFLTAYHASDYAGGYGQAVDQPMRTVTTKDRLGLVRVEVSDDLTDEQRYNAWNVVRLLEKYDAIPELGGWFGPRPAAVAIEEGLIVDLGMRMLEPLELLKAQFGRFAAGYDLRPARTKTAMVRLIGNSVSPEHVEAIIRANVPHLVRRVAA